MYVSKIELKNIRCFSELCISLEDNGKPVKWLMILGDNAVGKTTLLRSIALGLCDQTSAAALMKEVSGEFLQKNEEKGWIRLTLKESECNSEEITIITEISKESPAVPEKVNQSIKPENLKNPWKDIFVCGFGPQRASPASSSFEKYFALEAVFSLFNYEALLQNPELILRRQSTKRQKRIIEILKNILMLDATNYDIKLSETGMLIRGPWRRGLPLEVLSDGYRSTSNWVLNFLAWQIYANKIDSKSAIMGTLLIDEIENHIHPKWQRHIIQRIRNQFDNVQVITTTHSPLPAAGMSDIENAKLLKLNLDDHGKVTQKTIQQFSNEELKAKRADQVLTSDAFGLTATSSTSSVSYITRFAELMKKQRNNKEEQEYKKLRARLQNMYTFGDTEFEIQVEKAVHIALEKILKTKPTEVFDYEIKKQLKEIFKSGKTNDKD